mgnify:CR=1 FL=1
MKHLGLRYLKLWGAFFRNSLTRDMEFKMNFIADLFIDAIFYGSMYFFPLEDLIWFSSHSEYFLDVADSMLTGVIISMIYFTDIKEKFS